MKKNGMFIIPVVAVAIFALMNRTMYANGLNLKTILMIGIIPFVLMILIRPKKSGGKVSADTATSLLGDHAKDAFCHDPALSAKFQSAVSDCFRSMPKSAQKKLTELEPHCKNDVDTYAYCVAMGLVKFNLDDYEGAIKLYNKAVVLFPTAQLADSIGSCQQRIGELEKAMDSYEFALDLEPDNLPIRAKLATAYVADGNFEAGIEHAQMVLDQDENNASALATIAICHGVLSNQDLYKGYTAKAVENGYNEQKITNTVTTLKKRFKK